MVSDAHRAAASGTRIPAAGRSSVYLNSRAL